VTIPLPIETERLRIRAFEPDDLEEISAIYADPEVMRHVCLGVLDRERTAELLAGYRSAQDERGFSTWAVVERETGTVVGDTGFGVYAPTGEPELGYTFATAVWGRGYALEAASASIGAAFAHLPHRRLVAKIELGNERSLRLAERLGLQPVETIDVDGHPHLLLALERP
jgi:RimJ/RimL family protein N-acetyltransferase